MVVTRTPRSRTGARQLVELETVSVSPRRRVVAHVDKQWFLDRLEDKGWSMRELAKHMHLDIAAISLLLDGKRRMKASEASLVARHLGVAVDEVLRHVGADVREVVANAIGIKGTITRGVVSFGKVHGPATVIAPIGSPEGLIALRATSDLFHGWVLFYRESPGIRPEAVGKLCVITIRGEDQPRVGWLRAAYEEGEWEIIAFDVPEKLQATSYSVVNASPVMWVKQ